MMTPATLLARVSNDPYAGDSAHVRESFERCMHYLERISSGQEDEAQKILYALSTEDVIRLLRICKRATVLIGGP